MFYKRLSFTLLMIVLMSLFIVSIAFAHGLIAVNGQKDTNEWLAGFGSGGCPALPGTNSSGIYTSSQGCTGPTGNEFIWTDTTGDQRNDHWGGTGNLDLKEFRLTGDSNNLNFLVEFSDITNCDAQFIAIALNSNDTGGTTFFPDNAETNLGNFGNGYERVIDVNTTSTGYWSNDTTFTTSSSSYCDPGTNLWEISIPTAGLGISWPASSGSYDFAVAIFCNAGGAICETFEPDAMDVITTVGGNTWNEVGDGTLDYNFTMGFSPTALSLTQFRANRTSSSNIILVAVMGLVLGGGGWLVVRRKVLK